MTDAYVIVPRVATEEMRREAIFADVRSREGDLVGNTVADPALHYVAMISAAPSAGRVSRKRLRGALDRANHAGRAEWQDLYEGNVSPLDLARKAERQAEDALAAALGIEIAEE